MIGSGKAGIVESFDEKGSFNGLYKTKGMYDEVGTSVKIMSGETKDFMAKVNVLVNRMDIEFLFVFAGNGWVHIRWIR